MNCFKCNNFCKLISLKEDFYLFLKNEISLIYSEDINFCKNCNFCYQQNDSTFLYFKLNNKYKPIYSVIYYFDSSDFIYYCFKQHVSNQLEYIRDLKFNEIFNYGEKYLDNIMFL